MGTWRNNLTSSERQGGFPYLTTKSFQKKEKYGTISSNPKGNTVTASIKTQDLRGTKAVQRYVSHSGGNSLLENNEQLHVTLPKFGRSIVQSCLFSTRKIMRCRDT